MGKRLWLPVGSRPHVAPQDERAELENRLWELRRYVPGSRQLELQQLRDLVQWVEHTHAEDEAREAAQVALGRQLVDGMTPMQRRDALKDFLNHRARMRGEKPPHRLGT